MLTERVDLTGLTIIDIGERARLPLTGEFDDRSLADLLVQEWIPYFECHKCGRFDYCKHVQRVSATHARDIKCGVFADALRSFVRNTFHVLRATPPEHRQDYLDAAFHYGQFVYGAELKIGVVLDQDMVDFWEEYRPRLFSGVLRLRDQLDKMAEAAKYLPEFRSERAVLLVEGESEEAFLVKLRECGLTWFTMLLVESYQGRGNAKPSRLQMLLQSYEKTGYRVFVQADRDGRTQSDQHALSHRGLVPEERVFFFRYDFETALPSYLLLPALQGLGHITDVTLDRLDQARAQHDGALGDLLLREFALDVKPIKVHLAQAVAAEMNRAAWDWPRDERFWSSELGAFVRFVQRVI